MDSAWYIIILQATKYWAQIFKKKLSKYDISLRNNSLTLSYFD